MKKKYKKLNKSGSSESKSTVDDEHSATDHSNSNSNTATTSSPNTSEPETVASKSNSKISTKGGGQFVEMKSLPEEL